MAEVAAHCTEHMQRTEHLFQQSPYCCETNNQPELSNKMRAILISWLVEVHLKYNLLPETLYIAVNLVDRFCAL